ncbi:cytochrome c [Magnetovibrio sp.]|uniref:c-type cytochrome n=1 Tax=Magnetovibrio sp. TaxID=2024836 RepID=UPI002F92CEAB
MMMKRTTLFACAALAAISFTAPAMADDAGEIKYRKSVMKSIGGHMGSIAGIFKAETGNQTNLAVHTQGMAALATITGSVFPKGSDFGETGALPVIWEKPDDFAKAVKMFESAAANMNAAAMSGDMAAAGAAFGELGKSCKNCHENFREKKK